MKIDSPDEEWKFVGNSTGRCRSLAQARKICSYDVPVIITGPSGVGKDVLANDIHRHSRRKNHPFVAINCASLTPELVDAELFGVARGAYTGAVARDGLFQAAHCGTLFFDEVGDLSATTQTRLLRVLENGTIRPVGSPHEQTVNVRIISATNKNIESMIEEAKFRFDLFSRLARFTISIPPIDASDISTLLPVLATTLVAQHSLPPLTAEELDTITALSSRPWNGNVRDLQSALERYCIFKEDTRNIDTNWRVACGEEAWQFETEKREESANTPETFTWLGKNEIQKTSQLINDLIFIDLCLFVAGDSPKRWGLFQDIACAMGITGAGVAMRLKRLELAESNENGPQLGAERSYLSIKKMQARNRELRRQLAPYKNFLS